MNGIPTETIGYEYIYVVKRVSHISCLVIYIDTMHSRDPLTIPTKLKDSIMQPHPHGKAFIFLYLNSKYCEQTV